MATIKYMAMNLIRGAAGKDSLESRRKAAAWNHDSLRALVTGAFSNQAESLGDSENAAKKMPGPFRRFQMR